MIILTWAVCAQAQQPRSPHGLITLAGGDTASGAIAPSSDDGKIAWHCDEFDRPFQFDIDFVHQVEFRSNPSDKTSNELAKGSVLVELEGGDRCFGDLIEQDDETLTIAVRKDEKIVLRRASVRRVLDWSDGRAVKFIGPGKVEDWTTLQGSWTDRFDGLSSGGRAASITRDINLQDSNWIELELSWQTDPHFIVAFGVDLQELEESAKKAFRIERWRDKIVAVWESEVAADLVPLATVQPDGELRLRIEIHQKERRAEIFSAAGQSLGSLQLPSPATKTHSGLLMKASSGIVRLHRVQVVQGVPVPAKDFEPLDSFEEPVVAPEDDQYSTVRAMMHDGSQWTGKFVSIGPDEFKLIPQASGSELTVPLSRVRTMEVVAEAMPPEMHEVFEHASAPTLIHPYYEAGSTHLRCRLLPSTIRKFESPISLELLLGSSAYLTPLASGRIVMKKPSPDVGSVDPQPAVPQRPRGILNAMTTALGRNDPDTTKTSPTITLRTGEIIPAEIVRSYEKGIEVKSEDFSNQRIDGKVVRSVLLNGGKPVNVEQIERERLLTVPRMRKKNPPTHLLIGANGDMLRCRLISIDEQQVVVQARLETIKVDRLLVSQIVWLQLPEQWNEFDTEDDENREFRIEVVSTDGHPIRFKPTEVTDSHIAGIHPVLGETRTAIENVREILFGRELNDARSLSPEQRWQLMDARELELPDEHEDQDPGKSSELVGKPAPNFKLSLLDGTEFEVSRHQGKVVVFDFWASWCGPCLQAMPVIDATIAEFDPADVQLITVNLQESAETIRETLGRLKLNPLVAMDIDGVAAGRYQANAIPQTVVIDRHGIVTRVFVGGGAKLADLLRQAIAEAIDNK